MSPGLAAVTEVSQDLYEKTSADLVSNIRLINKFGAPKEQASVIGTLKYLPEYNGFSEGAHGNFFPFTLGEDATGSTMTFKKNGQPTRIENTSFEADNVLKVQPGQKWEIIVDDQTKVIFDFSDTTFDKPPVDEVVIARPTIESDTTTFNKQVSDCQENVKISPDGKVTGKIKWVTGYENGLDEQYQKGNWMLLHFNRAAVGTDDIKAGFDKTNLQKTDQKDFNTCQRITPERLRKPYYVVVDDIYEYVLDLSGLELEAEPAKVAEEPAAEEPMMESYTDSDLENE